MRFTGKRQIISRFRGAARSLLALLCLALCSPGLASADGLSGFVEFADTLSRSKSEVGNVETGDVKSNSFVQRYSLSLNRSLYPLLGLSAGGIFEKALSDSTVNGDESSSSTTQLSRFVNLSMGTSPVTASAGYTRNETTASSSASPEEVEDIFETYSGRLSLLPEGLPSLSLLGSRANSFDEAKLQRDTTSDFYSLSSRYQPLPNLNLNLSSSFTQSHDRITGMETDSSSTSLRGEYTQQFFKKRLAFFASGTLGRQQNRTKGTGEGFLELLPVGGYFAISDSVSFLPLNRTGDSDGFESWTSLPQLVGQGGGRDRSITAINLGVPPLVNGDARPRQLGLDFGPASDPQRQGVNTIHVYVPLQGSQPLPSEFTRRFRWDVYSSTDNQNWSQVANDLQALFERDFDQQLQAFVSRFVISIPTVPINDPNSSPGARIQYVKVVVSPLPQDTLPVPGFDRSQIYVNKVEAFFRAPMARTKGSSMNALLDSGIKYKLFDRPASSVLYDATFNYSFSEQSISSTYAYFFANGVSGNHRFNSYLAGAARMALEYAAQKGQESRTSYSYSASLQAAPLSTLRHVLVFSGRYSSGELGTASSTAIFLTNTAQLYQGIGANLTGGVSMSTNEDESENKSTFLNCGLNLVPHRTVSVNLSFSETRSEVSGGTRVAGSSYSRSGELSATYNPFAALFFFGSVAVSAQSERDAVVSQSFGGSWSPFRDGALQLNSSYSEALSSAGDQRTSTFSTSVRWNIRPGWWLDVGYGSQSSETTTEVVKSESSGQSLFTNLRLNL